MNNNELRDKIYKALQKRKAFGHKIRLIISGIAGLIVMFVYSQNQQNHPQKKITKSYSFNFPMSSCGDQTAGGTNKWYPIYINYNQENLTRIRQYFCCDAFYNPAVGKIQVASFYNRSRAEQLVAELKAQNFQNIRVGAGDVVNTSPSSSQNNCK